MGRYCSHDPDDGCCLHCCRVGWLESRLDSDREVDLICYAPDGRPA